MKAKVLLIAIVGTFIMSMTACTEEEVTPEIQNKNTSAELKVRDR
jgi:hypothetical protein